MIRELAETLGITKSGLYGAIHEAARKAGRRDKAVAMSIGRDIFLIPDENNMSYLHSPSLYSVVLIYGPTDDVARAAGAAAKVLKL